MALARSPQGSQKPDEFGIITSVVANGGTKVVVKITTQAIEGRGRAACIAMTAAKIRALAGNLPKEITVSLADFQ